MKPESSVPGTSRVAEEILAYFVEHPDAQDTLEGVMDWWLPRHRIQAELIRVKAALIELVEKGFIVERQGGDSRFRYAVNRRRLDEIRRLLGGNLHTAGQDPEGPAGD